MPDSCPQLLPAPSQRTLRNPGTPTTGTPKTGTPTSGSHKHTTARLTEVPRSLSGPMPMRHVHAARTSHGRPSLGGPRTSPIVPVNGNPRRISNLVQLSGPRTHRALIPVFMREKSGVQSLKT